MPEHCPATLTGMHIYRRKGEDPNRAYCACGDSRLRDGVPIDLQSEREKRRG